MSNTSGSPDGTLFTVSAACVGVGAIMVVVGYGIQPLCALAVSVLLLKRVLGRLDETGSPVP